MSKKSTIKQVENVETVEISKTAMPEWAKEATQISQDNKEQLFENGLYFMGKPGEKVRGIFLEDGLSKGLTKKGKATWTIQVMRMSSHKTQTFSVLQTITAVVDQIMTIAQKHDWCMKEVVFDAEFIAGSNGKNNFVKTITEVPVPKMENIKEMM